MNHAVNPLPRSVEALEDRAERQLETLQRGAPDGGPRAAYQQRAPEPLPSPLPDVPKLDPDLIPEAIREWCVIGAQHNNAPLDFTAIPALVTLSAAIGRTVGLRMKVNEPWVEVPVLWGFIVGRPSAGKTPALRPVVGMLHRLENDEAEVFESQRTEYEAEKVMREIGRSDAKSAIGKAQKEGNTEKAMQLARDLVQEPDEPKRPRLVVNDATVEKLGELLNENPRGLIQVRDELSGWMAKLDQYGHESDRSFWLECWNGKGSFKADRIGRGTVEINACAVWMLGGVQPGKLQSYVQQTVSGGFNNDGLMQRFQLGVYPDLPSRWKYSDPAIDPGITERVWATYKRLRNLDPAAIGAEIPDSGVPFLRFDDEAQNLFIQWQTEHMIRLREGHEPEWIESHLSKYQSLAGRLALVLHLVDVGRGPVGADSVARALYWLEYLEAHARRIYAPATDNGLSVAHLILNRRKDIPQGEEGGFGARDVYRNNWSGLTDASTVKAGLEVLVEYGHLDVTTEQTEGRARCVYAWRAAA